MRKTKLDQAAQSFDNGPARIAHELAGGQAAALRVVQFPRPDDQLEGGLPAM
ncbi:MAG TPA: hypothetical protein VJ793_23985 [Anaerolineae bacterium]|nr:hypothetical protein [Anaerolineae bacterium]